MKDMWGTTGQQARPQTMPPTTQRAIQAQQSQASIWGGSNYDPDDFYTRATNTHDHAETLKVRVRPDVLRLVEELVGDDDFPDYGTVADVVRDAIVHRLHYIHEAIAAGGLQDRLGVNLERFRAGYRFEQEQRITREWERIIESMHEVFAQQVKNQDWWRLESLLTETENDASTFPSPWGPRLTAVCKEWRAKIPADFDADTDAYMW